VLIRRGKGDEAVQVLKARLSESMPIILGVVALRNGAVSVIEPCFKMNAPIT